jgi:hypothetical protein
MVKKSIKSALVSAMVLAIVACTGTIPDSTKISSLENFQDLDKEYRFSTKELTQSYLKRKLDKWLDTVNEGTSVNGPKLIKEIFYAKYKHPGLFCTIIQEDPPLLEVIEGVQEVQDRMAFDIDFSTFVESCLPHAPSGEFVVNNYTNGDQKEPVIAMNNAGNFVTVWSGEGPGDDSGIFAQRYDSSGLAQGSEVRVNTFTTNKQVSPSVAMDSAGDFVISWDSYSQDGFNYGVYAQRYNADGSKPLLNGSEFRVNTFTSFTQNKSSVAMDSAGDFVISWNDTSRRDGYGYAIYAQRYNSDGSKPLLNGSEFRVNTFTDQNQRDSSIAMDSSGDFVVTWMSYSQDGSRYGIFAQRYNSDGSKPLGNGSEFLVNSITAGGQIKPTVAMDSAGDFVIAWEDYSNHDGSGRGIFARRYDSTGTPADPAFLVNTNTVSIQSEQAIAMDHDGDFVITWQSYIYGGRFYEIYAQRYNSDGSKPLVNGSEFLVNSISSGGQKFPSIAMDSAGDFVVAWSNRNYSGYYEDGSGTGIFAQKYNNNGTAK